MTDEDKDFSLFVTECHRRSNGALVRMHGNETCNRRRAAIRRVIAERKNIHNQVQSIALTAYELKEMWK